MPARDSLQTRCYFICGEKKAANLSSGSAAVKRSEQSREYWTQFLLKVKKKFFLLSLFQLLIVCSLHDKISSLASICSSYKRFLQKFHLMAQLN